LLSRVALFLPKKTMATKGTIQTNKGTLHFELYDEAAPIAVANFTKLIGQGFYDGLIFHRVIPNFMVQTGCPQGTGVGGPGWTIPCETKGGQQYHDRGVLSMAHRGPNTGGSQFFICHNRQGTQHLDGVHTCFGKLTDGFDVLDAIVAGDRMEKVELA
jgi:peptidyl-prolyl cis-trans isomerase B (cyclophilin B)